jgi:hypothetical protein
MLTCADGMTGTAQPTNVSTANTPDKAVAANFTQDIEAFLNNSTSL